MSYAFKKTRPDSRDTAALRKEYQKKADEFRDTKDPASKAKLRDDKQKAFGRVVDHMNAERAEDLAATHKVLTGMGKLKTLEQVQQEKAKVEGKRADGVAAEMGDTRPGPAKA